MNIKHYYYYFKSALSEELCEQIKKVGIEKLNNSGKKAETLGKQSIQDSNGNHILLNNKTKEEVDSSGDIVVRDSDIAWIDEQWLYNILQPYINHANENAGWKYDWDWSESIQFTKYKKNQFYGWHADGGGDHNYVYTNEKSSYGYERNPNMIGKIRKLSMTVNLCRPEEYEGGNLKFDFGPHREQGQERYHECIEIRPQGSIIVFPSYVYHQVTPVTSGTRYSLVMWCDGYPFR